MSAIRCSRSAAIDDVTGGRRQSLARKERAVLLKTLQRTRLTRLPLSMTFTKTPLRSAKWQDPLRYAPPLISMAGVRNSNRLGNGKGKGSMSSTLVLLD